MQRPARGQAPDQAADTAGTVAPTVDDVPEVEPVRLEEPGFESLEVLVDQLSEASDSPGVIPYSSMMPFTSVDRSSGEGWWDMKAS